MAEPFSRNLNITDRNAELLQGAERVGYREMEDGTELNAFIFFPGPLKRAEAVKGGGRSAILFFFSSMWDTGTVTQFAPQCMHFTERGMVPIIFDYRVRSRHGTGPEAAMEDAREAIRWVRVNAAELGVNPEEVVASGGAAGAHIALMAALVEGVEESKGSKSRRGRGGEAEEVVSCVPDGLVLFSPVVDVSKNGCGLEMFADAKAAKAASPLHVIRRVATPPTIIFHSVEDRRVPIAGVRKFAQKMRAKQSVCELVEFGGVGHSFFNFNVDSRMFDATMNATDEFLELHGFVEVGEI